MKILAMDTSSVNATVAVSEDNRLLGEYTISNDRAHSQIIMPMLEDVLKYCSLSVNEIDVWWGVFSGKYKVLINVPISIASAMAAM